MDNSTLIIKSFSNSFEKIVNEAMTKNGCDVADFRSFSGEGNRLKRYFSMYKGIKAIPKDKYSKVIVFDKGLLFFLFTCLYRKASCYLWLWNSYDSFRFSRFKMKLYNKTRKVYSFDKEDCLKYGLKFNTQFYFDVSKYIDYSEKIEQRAYFSGLDKGRYDIIESIVNVLNQAGVRSLIKIKPDSTTKTDHSQLIHDAYVPYQTVIDDTYHSTVVVDVSKNGQSGMTYRGIEALFLDKKIITNNIGYLQEDFYSKNKVFVLGHDPIEELPKFVSNNDDCICSNEIKTRYGIPAWLSRFS